MSGNSSSTPLHFWQKVVEGLWYIMIFILPITSMPVVVKLVHSDTVAAPSGVILLILMLIYFVPGMIKGKQLPNQFIPLAGFITVAILATLFSAYIFIPPFKEGNFYINEIQAIITLGVGACFYLITAVFPTDKPVLEKTIRCINLSGMVVLIWSLLQATAWFSLHVYPVWMEGIQRTLSTGVLYKARVSGFTLEPSWLAHQLNMLYIPLWLACSVRGWSAHRLRLKWFTPENILLVGSILVMFLTFSRVGMLAIVFMLAYLIFKATVRLSVFMRQKIWNRWNRKKKKSREQIWQLCITIVIFILLVVIFLAMLAGVAYTFSRLDPRMSDVFQFSIFEDKAILRYANRLDFAPRVVYWQAGWEIFNEHPWMGVGLGNAGYFFPQTITPYGWNFMEVGEMMNRSSGLTNIKSLWVRILAESGILGFIFFISWLYTLWKSASQLSCSENRLFATLGLAGIFVMIGLLVEGFSVDSFALPYYWTSFGLITSAYSIYRRDFFQDKP